MSKEEKLETEQISFRIFKTVRSDIDAAAKAEGITPSDWVRNAIDYYFLKKTNICKKCGTYNSLDSKFCKNCANELYCIQKRLLAKRYNILMRFMANYMNYMNEIAEILSTDNVDQELITNKTKDLLSVFKIWNENKVFFQQLKDEILKYDLDPNMHRQLKNQDDFIDDMSKIVSNFNVDVKINSDKFKINSDKLLELINQGRKINWINE